MNALFKTPIRTATALTAITTVSFFLFMGIMVAYGAWLDPPQGPPGGNVAAPVNVGDIVQQKSGPLVVNTGGAAVGFSIPLGNVGIGTLTPGSKLEVQNGDVALTDTQAGQIHRGGIWWNQSWYPSQNTGIKTMPSSGFGGGEDHNALVLLAGGNNTATVHQDGVDINGDIFAKNLLPMHLSSSNSIPSVSCDSPDDALGAIEVNPNGDVWLCSTDKGPQYGWRLISSSRKICASYANIAPADYHSGIPVPGGWTDASCRNFVQQMEDQPYYGLGCLTATSFKFGSVGMVSQSNSASKPSPNCGW